MAVNYGSNSLKTTGDIIGAQGQPSGRTLYFNGGDWASASNWYLDAAKTIQSSSIPTVEDIAILDGDLNSNSGTIEAHTIILRDSGSISINSATIYAKYILLYDSCYLNNNSGNIGSSARPTEIKFYNDSYISNAVTSLNIYGNIYFYDNADNGGSSSGAYGITVYGNLYINVQSTGSYGFVTGGSSNTIHGDVHIYNQTTTTTDLLKYCYVYGDVYLGRYAAASHCNFYGSCAVNNYSAITSSYFYGPSCDCSNYSYVTGSYFYGTNSHFTYYSYSSTNYVYNCESEFSYYGYIGGDTYFYDSIAKINYYGYINSGTTYLYDGSKLILNGDNTSGSNVTISGDSNKSVVEMYQEFGQNGLGSSSTLTCGTLSLYGNSYLSSMSTLNVDKVKLYGTSYISSANTLPIVVFNNASYCNASVTSDTYFQFNDDSYLAATYTLSGSTSDVYVEFNNKSYNNGTIDCETTIFNHESSNLGTINYNAIFNDYSEHGGSASAADCVFNDFSRHTTGTINGNLTRTAPKILKIKSVAQNYTLGTMAADNDLTFDALEYSTYHVELYMIIQDVDSAATGAAFALGQISIPAGASVYGDWLEAADGVTTGNLISQTNNNVSNIGQLYAAMTVPNDYVVLRVPFVVTTTNTSGPVGLNIALLFTGGTLSINIMEESYILAQRIK